VNRLRSLFKYVDTIKNRLAGYGVNGRNINVCPDDVFIVGYPKSGNTWLDFLIACLRAENAGNVDFETVEYFVADIYVNSPQVLNKLSRPRFLKSHEPYDARYPKVVYIVRDPRAVAVSYYHHLIGVNQISADFTIDQYVPQFISGTYDSFGSWNQHALGWLEAQRRHPDKIKIVRYEDLKSSPEILLADIVSFLGLQVLPERLQEAISWSSPENMRRLEVEARQMESPVLAGFGKGTFFVRKASSQGWKQELNASLQKQIKEVWGNTMQELGYIDVNA
jgi:hypothetical protein